MSHTLHTYEEGQRPDYHGQNSVQERDEDGRHDPPIAGVGNGV